ncbi:8-oxoguanine DNA glycosylase OGG fold protein [Corynebacterium sanguinis]|uniref:8-oxoguanine DNA glycosylase OGG fold protein n=1 Tax=Corynebacterium sanguinis TaxID=2594913 RepID=UPI00223B7925|nr:hypothetical protein [Corynebacterium sanguinis]MCT1415190.1 hypothetical protein [Corynebacterium sanguinis]
MARPNDDFSHVLRVLGPPEDAASTEIVWGQMETFRPEWWVKSWPSNLPLPHFLARDDRFLSVSRQRLFELGESVETEAEAVSFYVAVCSWGAGMSAQQTQRCLRPLHQPDAPAKLLQGLKAAALNSADDAYFEFRNYSRSRIKHLGPAFFTKLLYFASGRPSPAQNRHPLILDRRVADAIGWANTSGWLTAEYSRYLDIIEQVHGQWRPDLPTDVIEYTLFQAGRSIQAPSI